ncbi:DUF2357 domain-containing protein [Pseudanabaena galeata UHCC 0370]|uniref:DUF2357 domain-containing protein n=1 Tax=Pseudanabaena galeata UHCC 0370 TaxID=3110310 RepID=A0ABU5TF91_9CYAN|nr:DUF2357 domain-containing protein [Pseudanabaena galeata]MEA5476736.1 DUF2357 domain-containing protein [Pseudanabaena galeata UHCC 0370]
MKIWDRLQQKFVQVPLTSKEAIPDALLGQWQVKSDHDGTKLNGIHVQKNTRNYLVPDATKRWTLQDSKAPLTNKFSAWQIPVDSAADSLGFFAKQHQQMLSKQNTWQDWANLSPLVPEIASAIQIQPLEKSIKDAIPHLKEICHRPRSYLKMETEKLPVARVQRIAPHAIAYLTSHTEDWECKTFRGIRPKNVLSLVREELLDIYENRVTVRLIDHILVYLRQRIRDVEKLKNELEQVLNFSEVSQSIHWRNRERICHLWGENFDAAPQLKVAEVTLNFLEQIKQKLLTLTDTDLYKAIPRSAEVESTLRNTNILIGDRHYREIAKLWREWSKWLSKRSKTAQQLFDFYQQTINGFDAFCCLLCSKVLTKTERDRGFDYLSDSALPERGQSYSLQQDSAKESESLNFQWLEDGSIQLESEKLGILKFIPLVAQLVESPDEQTSEQILKLFESVIDQANSQPYRTIILYFGTAQDVSKISPKLRRYFNTIGNDLLNSDFKSDRKLALLPVSPFDILSTERVARAIQWWIYSQKCSAYPIKNVLEFRLPDELLKPIQQTGAIRHSPQNNQLLFIRPLSLSDRKVFTSNLHSMIKREEAKGNSARGEVVRLRQLENLPESVDQEFESFLTCPTCQANYSANSFDINLENIGNDCFEAHCQSCNTTWGLQRCGQCQTNYPYIKLGGANPEISDRSVGWCNRVFGRDVISVPCFDDNSLQFYICSNCGSCGNSSQSSSYSCQRC